MMNAFAREQVNLQIIAIIMGLCAGTFMLLLCSLTIWMAYDDDPPFVSVTARVLDSTGRERYVFAPGEVMQIRRDFCVKRSIPVDVGRELRNIDDNSALLGESTHQVFRKGCAEGGNIVQLPAFIPNRRYTSYNSSAKCGRPCIFSSCRCFAEIHRRTERTN